MWVSLGRARGLMSHRAPRRERGTAPWPPRGKSTVWRVFSTCVELLCRRRKLGQVRRAPQIPDIDVMSRAPPHVDAPGAPGRKLGVRAGDSPEPGIGSWQNCRCLLRLHTGGKSSEDGFTLVGHGRQVRSGRARPRLWSDSPVPGSIRRFSILSLVAVDSEIPHPAAELPTATRLLLAVPPT